MNFELNKMSFLCSKEDAKLQAKKLMYQWAYSILEETGIDFEDTLPEDGDYESLEVLERAFIRKKLEVNQIFVLDNRDETLEIYIEDELIAKWDKPYYKLHFDGSKVNPKERFYMEVDVFFGSVFDK